MTTSIIHLAVGLVLLVAVNIVLGSLNALFDGSFDKVKLRNGASNLALLTAYVLYAKDVLVKLKNLILSKTSGTPPEEPAAEQETAE